MSANARPWLVLAMTLGYLVAAHFAFTRASPAASAMAVALLVLLILVSIVGTRRVLWRAVIALAGLALVYVTAGGAPPVLLLLPPVLIPAGIALAFGRTLVPGRRPLIERVVRVMHAPAVPGEPVIEYARGVTWAWTLLLAAVSLANAILVANLSPDGLLDLAGFNTGWPVSRAAFAWFSNTGTYLLIAAMFVGEFAVRVWRFPYDEFRNPMRFLRAARARMPGILEALRHG